MNLGPNISTDDLVLYLDAANVDSFRGEPTTNLLYDNGVINWTIGNLTVTVSRTTVIENSVYRITSGNFVNQFTSGSFRFYVPLVKLTNGATYTMSYKWRLISGGPTFSMNDWCDTSLSNVVNLNFGDYNYASATGTRSTYDSTFRFMDFNMSPFTTVEIYDVQLEQKNYSTPFVNGTRGTTVATGGGVADISNNNNHGELINGTTFNSSNLGNIIFDGTDDYINVTNSTTLNLTNQGTISIWIYPFSLTQGNFAGLVAKNTSGSTNQQSYTLSWRQVSNALWAQICDGNSTYNTISTSLPTVANVWYNIVFTWSGTQLVLYNNGIVIGTLTQTINCQILTTSLTIGGFTYKGAGGAGEPFNGRIANVQIYNRALSTDEIQQNFNATKTRFGL